MSDDFDFLGKLRGQLQYAIQWLPKGSIGPMQVRPSATVGQVLTTTANGAEWQTSPAGVTDHGALTGLADDDHPQYLKTTTAASTYQPLDADLTTIAALDSGTSTGVMATEAAGWVKRTYAQVKTSLGLVKADVGLGNVDNTSDANKPVSTAQQSALDLKANLASPTFTGTVTASGATAVTVPTVAIGAGSNAATIGAVNTALGAYLTTSSASSTYMPLSGGTGTGTWDLDAATSVLVPTVTSSDSSTKAASTAFVKSQRMSDLTLPNAAVPMNSQKFTGLAAGSANGDSLRYEQLFTTSNVGLLAGLNAAFGYAVNVGVTAGSPQAQLGAVGGASTVGLYSDYSHTQPMTMLSSYSGLSFGAGGSSSVDWNLSRTAANEATVAAGDVLKHDTAAENSANTVVATTAYVDRATGNASSNRPACRVTRAAVQSVVTASEVALSFDTEVTDTDAMWASGTPTKAIIVTPGFYTVGGYAEFAANTTGRRIVTVKVNGAVVSRESAMPNTSGASWHATSHSLQLAASDYVEVYVLQDSGGNLNVTGSMSVAWVGGTGAAWGNAGVRATQTTAQSCANGVNTLISFDGTDTFDIDASHDPSTNPSRLTCKTAGTFLVKGTAAINDLTTTGARYIALYKNGTVIDSSITSGNPNTSTYCHMTLTELVQLNVGDYVELGLVHSAGSSKNTSPTHCSFGMVRVGYQTNPADLPGTYVASMYAANSGAPTHTSSGGWQKVGSGGGTLTWTSEIDKRPSGVSAQVDTATNKRIDIRKTGLYRVGYSVAFSALADGKTFSPAVYKNGALIIEHNQRIGSAGTPISNGSRIVSLTSGDYLELYAWQDDSASEAYHVGNSSDTYLQAEYLGPAT